MTTPVSYPPTTELPPKGSTIYFIGIAGTGMASVAGLLQEAGWKITGSDQGIYPPMSTQLQELGIEVKTPWSAANIDAANPALVVVANALSRGHVEIEHALQKRVPYTSFPSICGTAFIKNNIGIVVTGTHGKTTTTSLVCHVLNELGEDPGFIVGGIPRNFPRSFRLGKGKTFVIEGDEYDTAFFDKGPKFLHYHPHHLIVNNIEFDHADIYKNVEAIEEQFWRVSQMVPSHGAIIANCDDPGVQRLLKRLGKQPNIIPVATLGEDRSAPVGVESLSVQARGPADQVWTAQIRTRRWGRITIETRLGGKHNIANISQVLACLESLQEKGLISSNVSPEGIQRALSSFKSVARRLDHLGSGGGIEVYEDFAHHPTAVGLVIEGFRKAYPERRLVVAFEPKNATSRRNVFQADYVTKLGLADRVFIGPCPVDQRIPETERMNTQDIARGIGRKASAHGSNEELLAQMETELRAGDAVIFMSSSSFSGIQHQLARKLTSHQA